MPADPLLTSIALAVSFITVEIKNLFPLLINWYFSGKQSALENI